MVLAHTEKKINNLILFATQKVTLLGIYRTIFKYRSYVYYDVILHV